MCVFCFRQILKPNIPSSHGRRSYTLKNVNLALSTRFITHTHTIFVFSSTIRGNHGLTFRTNVTRVSDQCHLPKSTQVALRNSI